MMTFSPSKATLVRLVTATLLLSGCAATSNEPSRPEGPSTDPSEARSVGDIRTRLHDDGETGLGLAANCEKRTDILGYDACFREDAKPVFAAAEKTASQAVRDLSNDVGPECRRALRVVLLSLGSEALTFPEDDLTEAEKVCHREEQA